MELQLIRYKTSKNGTQGLLLINNRYLCHTLELPWLNNKVRVSCILAGRYKLIQRTTSSKGDKQKKPTMADKQKNLYKGTPLGEIMSNGMIEISGIPGRSMILIHKGNKITDIQGCVIIGDNIYTTPSVSNVVASQRVYDRFYPLVMGELLKGEDVYIDINWIKKF